MTTTPASLADVAQAIRELPCFHDQVADDGTFVGVARESAKMALNRAAALVERYAAQAAPLESTEARYRDLLGRLGVQGHAGAVAEIEQLRARCWLDAAPPAAAQAERAAPDLPKPAVYMHKDGTKTWHQPPNYANGPVAFWNSQQMKEYARAALAAAHAQTGAVICPKCHTDRLKDACPFGHHAALTGACPMVGTACAQTGAEG